LQQLRYYHGSGEQFDDLATTQPANGMSSELARFVDIIQQNDRVAFAELFQLSARVNEVLYALRQDAGLHFPVTVEAATDDE
jgi:Tfp pilus assembly protein PilN